jgi:hypothetical protein
VDNAAESHDGERPYGATFEDLAAFLQRPIAGGYTVDVVRECVCASCGGKAFEIGVPAVGQAARRTCLGCREQHYIADSADFWVDDGQADYFCGCPCGNEEFAAAVGYSLRDDGEDVRWIFISLRCLACGMLGDYLDWKINYGPSLHLLELA